MSRGIRTYFIMVIVLQAITALTIIFCLHSFMPQAVAQENTNLISIVPGASSPRNPEFFKPSTTSVQALTNVTWKNDDTTIHTVNSGTFNTGYLGPVPFQSGIINPGGTFKHLFTMRNTTNDYYCSIHPFMTGKIIVR
jgi:nitrite reductase (NO-forming)